MLILVLYFKHIVTHGSGVLSVLCQLPLNSLLHSSLKQNRTQEESTDWVFKTTQGSCNDKPQRKRVKSYEMSSNCTDKSKLKGWKDNFIKA